MRPEKGKRKSAAEELYRILRELVLSLPLGAPLPPVHLLKANYRVGYSLLNATLLRLEKEKQIVIKQRKGIFVVGSRNGEQESPPEPKEWDRIFMMPGRPSLELRLYETFSGQVAMWRALVEDYNRTDVFCPVAICFLEERQWKDLNDAEGHFDLAVAANNMAAMTIWNEEFLFDFSAEWKEWKPEVPLFDFAWVSSPTNRGKKIGFIPGALGSLLCHHPDIPAADMFPIDRAPAYGELMEVCGRLAGKFPEHLIFLSQGMTENLYRMGIPLFDTKRNEICLTVESIRPFIRYFREFIAEKKYGSYAADQYKIYFHGGAASMLHKAALTGMSIPKGHVSPMPLNPGGKYLLSGNEVVIGRNSPLREEAWNFMTYLASERGQNIVAKHSIQQPAARNLYSLAVPREYAVSSRLQALHGMLAYSESPKLFNARFMIDMFLDYVLQGKMTEEYFCSELKERFGRLYLHQKN
ncbi:MAG: Bacterial regulatory proteins, gntR family [Lentisphaerae bacterium ADurb.Bin242]|nr:MAG: Bacterial regulatory proteins, gntR family [Lentisphaerae bacterium ADurb.Bin242]